MSNYSGDDLLYLSQADVIACDPQVDALEAALRHAFLRRAEGGVWSHPKMTISAGGSNIFRGKGAVMDDPAYAAFKWFGYFPGNSGGVPSFMPLIILNEIETGRPVAIMDGIWISAIRTALISLVAAREMARADAKIIGFLACGAQARSHLDVFAAAFPLTNVVAFSRRLETAEAFAASACDRGLQAHAVSDARAAIAGCDIVISSVPHGSADNRQFDANWVDPGTFVASVDLGFGWRRDSLAAFDRTVTDDKEQSTAGPNGILNYDGPFAGDLGDLVSGRIAGRASRDERNALIFSGAGVADLAAAAFIYETARAKGLGTRLPL